MFPSLEAVVLILHILGFFAFILVFLYLAPEKTSASVVFGTFLNGGGFSNNAQSVLVGAVDGATHMGKLSHFVYCMRIGLTLCL
jgi:choline transport protein